MSASACLSRYLKCCVVPWCLGCRAVSREKINPLVSELAGDEIPVMVSDIEASSRGLLPEVE